MANDNSNPYRGRVSIPPHAHPLVRLSFQLMRESGTTYDALEWKSGVLKSTAKSWRNEKLPGLRSIEAVLGVWGWRLVPCPPRAFLSEKTRAILEEISLDFLDDDQALAAMIAAAISKPREQSAERAPRLDYRGAPYWKHAA